MTLVSRILGFLRDMLLARLFGAGVGTDAFFVAFKIPNFLRRLFAEGAFSQAFVPVFSEYKSKGDENALADLRDHVAGTLGGILLLVSVLGILIAPLLIIVFAPGFLHQGAQYDLSVQMLRITFPYILFISLTAFAGGMLNTFGRFAVPAVTPVLLNLAMIGAALWLSPMMAEPVVALAWGVFIAGVAQLLFQYPALRRIGQWPRPRWGWRHAGVQRVLGLMMPAIFGSSVAQISLLIDTLIASFLVSGSVSWLYYSDRLMEFPLGVFGIALATVILPKLSQRHAENSPEKFSQTLDWGLRWVWLLGLPATVGLFMLAMPILATLFQYGEFSGGDVEMAGLSLMAYALGLPAFILIKVLAPGFYSRQDTRTPVMIGLIALASNLILNLLFVWGLTRAGVAGVHAGLALATTLSAYLNAGLLYRGLRREGLCRHQRGWGGLLLQGLLANGSMIAVMLTGMAGLSEWLGWGAGQRAVHLSLLVVASIAVYFLTLRLAGLRWRELRTLS